MAHSPHPFDRFTQERVIRRDRRAALRQERAAAKERRWMEREYVRDARRRSAEEEALYRDPVLERVLTHVGRTLEPVLRVVVLVIIAALMLALAALVFGAASPANNTWSDPPPVDEMTQDEIYEARGAYD